MNKIVINSTINSKFDKVLLNERDHLVAKMIPIIGDSIMNRIKYPDKEVTKSFQQLDGLPTPSSHPMINGENIGARNIAAINAFHIGGFIRNPIKNGKEVTCDLCIDTEFANKTKDGKHIINMIESGQGFIGVSTGLSANVEDTPNPDFDQTASDFLFDHVAILLNEEPAGGKSTKVINHKIIKKNAKKINKSTINKGDSMTLSEMIDNEDKLTDDIVRKVWAKASKETKKKLMMKNEDDDSDGLEDGEEKIVVNKADAAGFKFVKENKSYIESLINKDKAEKLVLVNKVVEATGIIAEDAEKLSEVSLKNMLEKSTKVQDYSMQSPATIKNQMQDIDAMLAKDGFFAEGEK